MSCTPLPPPTLPARGPAVPRPALLVPRSGALHQPKRFVAPIHVGAAGNDGPTAPGEACTPFFPTTLIKRCAAAGLLLSASILAPGTAAAAHNGASAAAQKAHNVQVAEARARVPPGISALTTEGLARVTGTWDRIGEEAESFGAHLMSPDGHKERVIASAAAMAATVVMLNQVLASERHRARVMDGMDTPESKTARHKAGTRKSETESSETESDASEPDNDTDASMRVEQTSLFMHACTIDADSLEQQRSSMHAIDSGVAQAAAIPDHSSPMMVACTIDSNDTVQASAATGARTKDPTTSEAATEDESAALPDHRNTSDSDGGSKLKASEIAADTAVDAAAAAQRGVNASALVVEPQTLAEPTVESSKTRSAAVSVTGVPVLATPLSIAAPHCDVTKRSSFPVAVVLASCGAAMDVLVPAAAVMLGIGAADEKAAAAAAEVVAPVEVEVVTKVEADSEVKVVEEAVESVEVVRAVGMVEGIFAAPYSDPVSDILALDRALHHGSDVHPWVALRMRAGPAAADVEAAAHAFCNAVDTGELTRYAELAYAAFGPDDVQANTQDKEMGVAVVDGACELMRQSAVSHGSKHAFAPIERMLQGCNTQKALHVLTALYRLGKRQA